MKLLPLPETEKDEAYYKSAKKLLVSFDKMLAKETNFVIKAAIEAITMACNRMLKIEKEPFEEMCRITSTTGIPLPTVVLANLSYEMSQLFNLSLVGCTSCAYLRLDKMFHIRTLDWDFPMLKKNIIYVIGNNNNYGSITFPGFVGVLSGFNYKKKFSISVNQAPCNGLKINIKGEPISFLIRKVLDMNLSFEQTVKHLQKHKSMYPAFVHVVGVKSSRIVETFSGTIVRDSVIANHYPYYSPDNYACGEDWLDDSQDRLDEARDSIADGLGAKEVLKNIFADDTIYGYIHNVSTGYVEAYK